MLDSNHADVCINEKMNKRLHAAISTPLLEETTLKLYVSIF